MTVSMDCACGNIVFARHGVSGQRECYRCKRIVSIRFSEDGTYEACWLPTFVQSCITALGFPDNLESLVRMADWHQEHDGRWVTDLESVLYENQSETTVPSGPT